jgi:hypothetical protein
LDGLAEIGDSDFESLNFSSDSDLVDQLPCKNLNKAEELDAADK